MVGTLPRKLLDLNKWKRHTPEDNIFLKWDPVAKVYTDNDGVEVRVPHADGRYF